MNALHARQRPCCTQGGIPAGRLSRICYTVETACQNCRRSVALRTRLGAVAVQRQGVKGEVALAARQRLQQSTVHSGLQAVDCLSGSDDSAKMHWPRRTGRLSQAERWPAEQRHSTRTSGWAAEQLQCWSHLLPHHLGDWRCGHTKHLAVGAGQLSSLQGHNTRHGFPDGIAACRLMQASHALPHVAW